MIIKIVIKFFIIFRISGNDIRINEARSLNRTSDFGLDIPALANGVQRSSTTPSPSLASMNNASKPEPEKIKKWREEQKIMLEKKGVRALDFFSSCLHGKNQMT